MKVKGINELANIKAMAQDVLDNIQTFRTGAITVDSSGVTFRGYPVYEGLHVKISEDGRFSVYSGADQLASGWFEGTKLVWEPGSKGALCLKK